MDHYLLNRLRADAAYLLNRSQHESELSHNGIKGRFRELLIDNILMPWLPPYIACGTGTIIAAENKFRTSTQDDVIIYDRSLTPPVLSSTAHAPDGVFLYNSVIARIEVKSILTRTAIRSFVKSSIDINKLLFSVKRADIGPFDSAYNLLFAYASDADGGNDPNFQIKRVIKVMREERCDPLSGIISMVCIPPYGFWKISGDGYSRYWGKLNGQDPLNNIAWFVGCTSSSCYNTHAIRQGRDPSAGLESGIGLYIPGNVYEKVII